MLLISCLINAIYKDKLGKKILTSAIIYVKYFPFVVLASLLIELPFLIFLIGKTYIFLFAPIVYGFLLLPPGYLGAALIMNHVFDKAINENSMPMLYRKGLAPIYTSEQR